MAGPGGEDVDKGYPMKSMMRIGRTIMAAAVLSFAMPAMAESLTDGPLISNPSIEEGTLSKEAKGVSKGGTQFSKGKQSKPAEMGQVTVSDRCFVTRQDYCYLDGYAPVGTPCACIVGDYYYDGVVY
jgi:hypothetical protein